MSAVPARFTLNDGEMQVVPAERLDQIYELLWQLAPKPGAVSMAAVIRSLFRESERYGRPFDLDRVQSGALREAVAMLGPDDPPLGR